MQLFLFYKNLNETIKLAQQNIDAIIIDWENKGKDTRQFAFDTQINDHSLEDLIALRFVFKKKIICRINGGIYITEKEIKSAIDAGADEILLPMVTHPNEVLKVLNFINGQCPLGILVETNKAVACIGDLIHLPLRRIYFGLNDFAIDNNNRNIFLPIATKTVELIRLECSHISFGFGGLTHPSLGSPLPCKMLLDEMARLRCDFTFLRRSFYQSLNHFPVETVLKDLKTAWEDSFNRDKEEVNNDFQQLKNLILAQSQPIYAGTHSTIR
jgi:HpcH/HpaI aldolase/citrate lyase family